MLQRDFIILSIGYLSREIQNDLQNDQQEDVLSLGLIWFQMFTGEVISKNSFNQITQQNIDQQIEKYANQIDEDIKNLLKFMLVIESSNRITFGQLIQKLRQLYSNQTNFDFSYLIYQQNEVQLNQNDFLIQKLKTLENQFKQEFALQLRKKQISLKKAKIDFIKEEISQNFFLIQNFFNDKHYLKNDQEDHMQVQFGYNKLDKWLRTDILMSQTKNSLQVFIDELILILNEKVEKSWLEKELQIKRELQWQIKQLILFEQVQIELFLNQNNGFQQTFSLQDYKQNFFNNIQIQLNKLNNSIIKNQIQYTKFQEIINKFQEDLNQKKLQNIIKLQKELVYITIEVDSLEKEMELEQLGNKIERDIINIINYSKKLIQQYCIIIDDEILILGELKKKDILLIQQNQQNHYFDDKIKTLFILKQNIIEEEQQLSKFIMDQQQIENKLKLYLKIKYFNEKINKFIIYQKQEINQFQQELQVVQQDQNNQQVELTTLINEFNNQLDLLDRYFQVSEIQCKDINIINNQYESKNELIQTLDRQSCQLKDCLNKLQLNNLVIGLNQSNFDSRAFFKQSCSKVYQQTLQNFTTKIQDILNLQEQVRKRIPFCDESFLKNIIVSWNQQKIKKEGLQKKLQDIKETQSKIQMDKDILKKQINEIKELIIQIKLQYQIKPSLADIKRFNQEYAQNQISYSELFTLVIYIKQHYNQLFLNLYISIKSNNLEKMNIQFVVQDLKKQQLTTEIKQCKVELSKVDRMMEEYLGSLQKKTETIKMDKLLQDNQHLTHQNQELENKIITMFKVKLQGNIKDQQLVNNLIKQQRIFEISELFCFAIE